MSKLLKDLVPSTISTAKAKTEDAPTIASRSRRSPTPLSFAEQYQRFVRYAQSRLPGFTVDAASSPVIAALLAYFLQDRVQCQQRGIHPQKGLFLMGPVGCGKTTLMRLFAEGVCGGSRFLHMVATDGN